MSTFEFRLFVSGGTPHSQKAIENLEKIRDQYLQGDCQIRIVDVLTDPESAEKNKILATPTLVRVSPTPQRRVIGDLSDFQRVITVMGIDPNANRLEHGEM